MRARLGWDVLFVIEQPDLRRARDAEHFRLARQLRRTLVTCDRDYLDDRRYPPAESAGVLVIAAPDARAFEGCWPDSTPACSVTIPAALDGRKLHAHSDGHHDPEDLPTAPPAVVVNEHAQVSRGDEPSRPATAPGGVAAAVRRALAAPARGRPRGRRPAAAGRSVPGDVEAALAELLPGSRLRPPCRRSGGGRGRALVRRRRPGTVVVLSTGEHVTSGVLLDGHP